MFKIGLCPIVSLAALLLGFAVQGSANSITVTITTGPFSAVNGATATFNTGSWPTGFAAAGNTGIRSGTVTNLYLEPTGETTPYAYVEPGGSVTDTLPGGVVYLGLDWGSPDAYNTLTFVDSNGVSTAYGLGGIPVPGLILDQTTRQYVNFFDSGAPWTSVTMTTAGIAFEFDNLTTATPEPASIVLWAGGLTAIGVGAIRRRRNISRK